jgi:hypothetical protein
MSQPGHQQPGTEIMKINRFLIALLALLATSCKDEFREQEMSAADQADMFAATSIMNVETLLNDLEFMVRNAPQWQSNSNYNNCAMLASFATAEGQRIDIDFGNGSTCFDNTQRSGKISLYYHAQSGNTVAIMSNYIIGGVKMQGTYSFQAETIQGKNYLRLLVPDGQLNAQNGDYIHFNMDRRTTLKEGEGTAATNDDVLETTVTNCDFELKGGTLLTAVQSHSTVPLAVRYSCTDRFRPRGGRTAFQRVTGTPKILDFGKGGCSDIATIVQP